MQGQVVTEAAAIVHRAGGALGSGIHSASPLRDALHWKAVKETAAFEPLASLLNWRCPARRVQVIYNLGPNMFPPSGAKMGDMAVGGSPAAAAPNGV